MILGRQSGLGRGLGALIPPKPPVPSVPPISLTQPMPGTELTAPRHEIYQIPVELVERNPHQPRVHFDHAQLEDLILSIKEHGVIQPLIVTALPDGHYQLIAGERRLRASTIAGLATVPVVVRTATEQEKLELAVIENVQRQDLNPIEEAKAYVRLMEEFALTQDEVSKKVGKSRPQVGNTVRLLQLPEPIQEALMQGKISASNARTLLSLPTEDERMKLFQAMLAGNFTVRQTEARVFHPRQPKKQDANLIEMEERLRQALHCRVQIKRSVQGEGDILLKFFSDEELQALLRRLVE
ncbi:ParB/RepB/Spo0J family partition protein [Candidatus Uhrbacteria bacterium]|nr:ParB/RepB/Spo0J family partition protein [Candidatus Uhrbacteria bacterium]